MLDIIMAIEDDNDRSFVEDIYNEHSKRLYKIAKNIVVDHDDAQDIVHETVEDVIDNIDKFRKASEDDYITKLLITSC